jgi:hypothetical protein
MSIDLDRAITIKQQNVTHLLRRNNVVGVGVGYKESEGVVTDELAVVVNVAQKLPVAQLVEAERVPKIIDGVKTDVIETGRFLAGQAATPGPRDRWRSAIPAGVSIGHAEVTAGTLGCLVRRGSEIFILSNNHVLANVNNAKPGDAIIQPARYDGGGTADKVGTLVQFIPLDFGGEAANSGVATGIEKLLNWVTKTIGSNHRFITYRTSPGENLVDVALARPLDPAQFKADILNLGRPQGWREAKLGMSLQKTGRTTGYTQGRITQIDVTISVDYNGRTATFTHQLIASGMSAGGDSGSLMMDEEKYAIGLLFAGSSAATLINPIQTVLQLLKVELVV